MASERLIKTPRLCLRLPDTDDAAPLLHLLNQKDFIENIRDKEIRTQAQARDMITNEFLSHYQQHGFCLYSIDTQNDQCIGLCGLVKRPQLDVPDIGFAIRTEFQRQGYITEAAIATRDYAFNTLGLDRLAGIVNPENIASIKILTHIGMAFVDGLELEPNKPAVKHFEMPNPNRFN